MLGEAAVAEYLRERFAGNSFAAALARVIYRRTEGNPLFMVSVVDDLVARDLIGMRDERWELRAALEEVEVGVPENLRQMIERRIGQLGQDEQRILGAGSVAGMEFSAASVAAALGRTTHRDRGALRRAGPTSALHPRPRSARVAGPDDGLALRIPSCASPQRALPGNPTRAAARLAPGDR